MASSQVIVITTMALLLTVFAAAHAADAPAPSPTSPAVTISPSFAAGFLTAAVSLDVVSEYNFLREKGVRVLLI
ncbi:hypothetical protein VNO77_10574 [Canavalia gladiata]|uniref:Uncharacterized protein n=1 Tax=Canavalia gladiata TaxID=3824 RepID=A0AAN9QXW7_CANGL